MVDSKKSKEEKGFVLATVIYGGLEGRRQKEIIKEAYEQNGQEVIELGAEEQINQTVFYQQSETK